MPSYICICRVISAVTGLEVETSGRPIYGNWEVDQGWEKLQINVENLIIIGKKLKVVKLIEVLFK